MKKKLSLFGAPIAVLALAGCMHPQPTTLPPGQYESTSKTVDSKGTIRKVDSNTNVYYDQYGNKKMTVDKSTTTDPKGLFNKSTSQTHTIEK